VDKIKEILEFLKQSPRYANRVAHIEQIPSRKAQYATPEIPFPEPINRYLFSCKLERLYRHQAEAIDAIRKGKNVIVTTPTASGKTLIYNLCVWESIVKDPGARALYIFPTKALTQDQLDTIREFITFSTNVEIRSEIYDGDTSAYRRRRIKKTLPHILLTNPDMLQMGILPFHSSWKDFLSNLRFIILDELHTYRGIFGTHVAHILRRLKRVLELYSCKAQFIASSATIDSAQRFARDITGEEFVAITNDGSPSGKKYFVLWDSKASPYTEACEVFQRCLDQGLKTILFTKSRRATELVSSWIKQERPDLSSKVASYRAGYLPSERRAVEADLFGGKLQGVISTSALELGIDVGSLDCCILLGYPGTVISTWQRSGRVGRGEKDALIIMIALDDALDKYFLRHPREFFSREWERMVISLKNEPIACEHLPCAAAEYRLSENDKMRYGENFHSCVEALERQGILLRDKEAKRWYASRRYPQRHINIRSIGERYSIIDLGTGKVMGDVDETRLYHECHPGAVYLHRAQEYEIVHLNESARCVYAQQRDVGYYTQPNSWQKIDILQVEKQKQFDQFRVYLGKVRVTEQVTGFEKRRKGDQSLIAEHPLILPERSFETMSLWVGVPSDVAEGTKGIDLAGSLHAIEHATIAIFPLKVTCDRQDLGGYSLSFHVQTRTAAIFIYDAYPGGVGLTERAFDIFKELFQTSLALIKSCPCINGCPSCIQSPNCGSGNRPLDKRGAILLLGRLLSAKQMDIEKKIKQAGLPEEKLMDHKRAVASTKSIVFFDIETQKSAEEVGGWQNKCLMRLSVAITYNAAKARFGIFTENNVEDLLQELLEADLVVGFNIKSFDYEVLSRYTAFDFTKIPTLDILEDVTNYLGFRLSLEHLCQTTLGCGKSGNGLDAIRWFEEGNMEKLVEYCKHDVKLVKELYEYGVENGFILFKNRDERILRIPVDWSGGVHREVLVSFDIK